jgi:hypothetical protein
MKKIRAKLPVRKYQAGKKTTGSQHFRYLAVRQNIAS